MKALTVAIAATLISIVPTVEANQYSSLNNIFNQYGMHYMADGKFISNNGIASRRGRSMQVQGQYYAKLGLTGLRGIHRQGWTGQGINVGIAEAGGDLRSNNPNGGANSRHRWAVTGVANKTAPGATITQLWSDVDSSTFRLGHARVANQDVINHSYGVDQTNDTFNRYGHGTMTYSNDYRIEKWNTAAPNTLHVKGAGNYGDTRINTRAAASCSVMGGRVVSSCTINNDQEDILNNWIIVGSIVPGNQLASYSQSAGSNADDYIVTYGTEIYGTRSSGFLGLTSSYSYGEGTSYAAPRVSGAAALVMQKFDTNAQQTKEILFSTADDLGARGVDRVYGHGKLNVRRAMSPVGSLR